MADDADLKAMAEDELRRALELSWRDLSKITPWGDDFEGISPAGRNVVVERAYVWKAEEGGDIQCEVRVYVNTALYDQGAAVNAVVPRG